MPLLRPVLKLLGSDPDNIELSKIEEMRRLAIELASIPDRFNDLFASRGWIIYDLMSIEVAKAAIQKAEAGDISGAETDLETYYVPETVQWKLQTMIGVQAFRPRMPLAQKALIDYREERYHACVPVILALLDGMVNEVHEKRRGFFAEGVSLEAWDSIAAHSRGLNQLVKAMTKMRQTTTTEPLTIPYRNGILHGMDLGYDNKTVAAKTWAALFATREWALKAEQGLLVAPPEESQKTWGEIFRQVRETDEDKRRIEAWKPRTVHLGKDIPVTGEPDAFGTGTPERKLAEFLTYWKARNYGFMAKCLSLQTNRLSNKLPAQIREEYGARRLKSFEFIKIEDAAPAATVIETKLIYEENGKEIENLVRCQMFNEDTDGHLAVWGKPASNWSVSNWRVM